ncbi:MAG: TetR/AcrR family transcriptional regulator [Kurthia sp.]|nr:TetR/AcrR family transcriptional regulator [Candidatus Kurthia equi]
MSKQPLIIQNAIELFLQKSISKTSIQDITNACGISKGAFYLNFRSKEHLLISIVDYFINDLTIVFQDIIDEPTSSKKKLEDFCHATMSKFHERFPLLEMLVNEKQRLIKSNVLAKVRLFDISFTNFSLQLLEKNYGERIAHNKYDLHLCFKGLMKSYITFTIHHQQNYQFSKIAQAIVHYLDALVEKQFPAIISEEIFYRDIEKISLKDSLKTALLNEIKICKEQYNTNDFYLQSMQFIESELHKERPNYVLLHGMAANLSKEADLKWLATLVKQYAPF